MTSFGCRDCASSALNASVKNSKKARVNGGSNYDSLEDAKKSLFQPPFLDLGVTYALRWKALLDFLFAIIEFVR